MGQPEQHGRDGRRGDEAVPASQSLEQQPAEEQLLADRSGHQHEDPREQGFAVVEAGGELLRNANVLAR